MNPTRFFLGILMLASSLAMGAEWTKSDLGETAVIKMESAPFPHESRKDGFTRNGKTFPLDPHYVDSSVMLFIPKGFKPGESTDVLVYTHGHNNNITKAVDEFKLREQVVAAKKNVVLIFPEGPKDAGDSGIGKLEDKDGLKNLVNESLKDLKADGKVPSTGLGKVVLAGHSGAYKGLGLCVKQGGLEDHITEAYLIDATYGQLEDFAAWAVRNKTGRMASIYTDHLKANNEQLMGMLKAKEIAHASMMDTAADDAALKANRVLFLHTTTLNHNQTVSWLEKFLRTSGLDAIE